MSTSLEVQIEVDTRGMSGAFMTFDWDTDLNNEINILEWEELDWAFTNTMDTVTRSLTALGPGIDSSVESTDSVAGTIYTFDGTTIGVGPTNTTLTFARLVFVSTGNVATDGADIFASGLMGPNNPEDPNFSDVVFINAVVNLVPEPAMVSLLVLSVAGLMIAGRRGRK